MFLPSFGSQISWLIPAALVLMAATLWVTRHRPRGDRTRAAVIFWGGWLLVTGLLLSFAKGIIHPYYTVALAPAIGAVVAVGATTMWRRRQSWFGRSVLAGSLLITTWWATVLLGRSSNWMPELRWMVLVVGVGTALALLVSPASRRRLSLVIGGLAVVVSLAGPAAYSLDTVVVAHSGAIPSAGPTAAGATGGPGGAGGFGPGGTGGPGGASRPGGAGKLGGAPTSGGTSTGGVGGRPAGFGAGRRLGVGPPDPSRDPNRVHRRRPVGRRQPETGSARPGPVEAPGRRAESWTRRRRAKPSEHCSRRTPRATRGWRPPSDPRARRDTNWPPMIP